MTQVETLIRTAAAQGPEPGRNTGWLTGYEHLFNAAGYSACNQDTIKKLLVAGGFLRVNTTKSLGLLDMDMPDTASALDLGSGYTRTLRTLHGVRNALERVGPLWVAMQIPVKVNLPHGDRHKHITVLVDVDETRNQVAIINSCKENHYTIPYKAWVDFNWFRRGVKYTQNLLAGCQFIKAAGRRPSINKKETK